MCPQQFHLYPATVSKDNHQDWRRQSLKGVEDSPLKAPYKGYPYNSNLDHRSCPQHSFLSALLPLLQGSSLMGLDKPSSRAPSLIWPCRDCWLPPSYPSQVTQSFLPLSTARPSFLKPTPRHWCTEDPSCPQACADTQSCPPLCDPMDCSTTGSSVHGILLIRILEWGAIASSRGSSRPRDRTRLS